MHQPLQAPRFSTMKRTRAALLALALAFPMIAASAGDDALRIFCIAIGPSHPLYDILGCPAIVHPPDPEG